MDDILPLPTPRRHQEKTSDGFKFSVTPESSRRRLSTSRGRPGAAGLEESPARYSPSKVKAAVRSFADFLHFLEQEEHQQEHTLMPVIIQRFAELGAVIESQKRHIDRWKGKELDLAIEEAQQNLELIRELGETIQKQELQIAGDKVEKQKWEEKYHLAAQEVKSLKKQGTCQIQQLRSEVAMLRQAGVDVETKLKERDASVETLHTENGTLHSQLERIEHDSSLIVQENATLKQQRAHQLDEMHTLEQEIDELRERYESVVNKATELEQDVKAWQAKYEEKENRVSELENALNHGRQEMGQREGDLEHFMGENRKLQKHMERMAQEHEKHLAEQYKYRNEAEVELQRLNQALQQESTRLQNLKKETGEMRAQIEAQAMSAMSQREQQLLDEKSRLEEELQHQFSKINDENIELRAKIENLKDINRRKSIEIGRLVASSQEADQQNQSRSEDTQRMQQLTEELARAKYQIEHLSKETATKDAVHEETMKSQSAEVENQYNNFVSQVEGQLDELTRENEQLRSELDEAAKKVEMYEGKLLAEGEELGKWRTECEKLQHQLHDVTREYDSLKRELEHRLYELELQNMKNAELRAQTEQFLSPDNERTKEVELLQSERVRLEGQNQELQRHIEVIRVEADARLNEAQQLHNHSLEQEAAHENTVRLLCEEKEAMNRNMMDLNSENSALEFQVTTANNEVERWKASVQQLENDKRGLELRIQEVMRQATEQIETQKQSAAIATEDGRTQLQELTAQLVHRDTQMNEGHQQLQNLQEKIRSLEEKLRAQQYEYESLRMKNEQLTIQLEFLHNEKRGLENIMPLLLHEGHHALEENLSQKLERFVREMDGQVQEASEKAVHLQAVLDSKLEAEQLRSSGERAKLEEENAKLQRELVDYAAELEKLDSELLELQREREKQNRIIDEMHQMHEAEKRAQSSASNELEHLEAAHEELKTTHDRMKTEMMAQLKEKESEVADLQDDVTELQSKLDQEKEMSRHLMDRSHYEKQERTKNSQVEKDLQIQVKELEATVTYLQRKVKVSEQSAGGNKYKARVKELEASVKHLQHKLEVSESAGPEHQAQVKELKASVKQLQDKLQASEKIAAESELQARVKEHEAQELRGSEQQSAGGYEQQVRVKELEAQVKQLQHELQVSEQSVTGREQRVMHEKLQKEREHRSIQARYDSLAVENAAIVTKLNAKVAETDHLRQEIDQLQEEIERLHAEIHDNMAEMDNARGHLHVSEELTLKLENLQDELAARENETRQYKSELATKDAELQHAREDAAELKGHLQNELQKKEDEVASLKRQNLKFQEQLKRIARTKLSPKHLVKADITARETAMREIEEAYERSLQRKQELTSQIAHLEDAKSAMLNQFRREMRRLNIECSEESDVDGDCADDSDFHRGIMKVSALLCSYQDREARQNALIHRKEKHIIELKKRLDEMESLGFRCDEPKNRDVEQQKMLHQQVEAMGREVSKLTVEHKDLRENPTADSNGSASELSAIGEWKEKCAKLKHRMRVLKEANMKLKEIRFSKGDMQALVTEVEKLTSQVLEKDVQIQALQNRETSRFTRSGASAGSRRSRDLLVVLQEKEDKIMVLNDHLTGLMTENMRLQHSTEQYVIRYGPLDGATTNGVIGNSGIRVPNGSNRQQSVVRLQSK